MCRLSSPVVSRIRLARLTRTAGMKIYRFVNRTRALVLLPMDQEAIEQAANDLA